MEKEIKVPDWSDLYRGLENEYREVHDICPQCAELLELFSKVARGGKEYTDVRYALWQTFKSESYPYSFNWGTIEDVINMLRLVRHIQWAITDDGQLSLVRLTYKNRMEKDGRKYEWEIPIYFITSMVLDSFDHTVSSQVIDKLIDYNQLPLKTRWLVGVDLAYTDLCNNWDLFMEIVRKLCDSKEVSAAPRGADEILKGAINK